MVPDVHVLELVAERDDVEGVFKVETEARPLFLELDGERVRGAEVTLVVTYADGTRVPEAHVWVNGDRFGSTDAEGRLAFVVPEGDGALHIVADLDGVETVLEVEVERPPTDAEPVDETSGGPTTVSEPSHRLALKLEGEPFRGTKVTLVVVDADGVLVPEADVWVNGALLGSTNAEGRFTFVVPDVDVLELVAERDDVEGVLKVETEARPLFLELDGERVRGAEVTLVVTYADGTRVPEANVWVNGNQLGSTDAEGRLAFVVPEGHDVLRIVADLDGAETVLEVAVAAASELLPAA